MKKQAFSLVELMVTLIIISCIVSALTPMITKKLKSQGITVGSGGAGSANLEFEQDCSQFGVDCALCFSNRCAMCAKVCLDSEYVDTPSCVCQPCTNLDSNCFECNSKQCHKCVDGFYVSGTTCEICPVGSYCNGIDKFLCAENKYSDLEGASSCKSCSANCKVCDSRNGVCKTCEDGYLLSNDACVRDCGELANLITLNDKQMCITKYNIGDGGLNYIPSNVSRVSVGTNCDSNNAHCCWVGNTADDVYCNANDSRYSGCGRTVCNWWAARNICNNMTYNERTWQLPTYNDLVALIDNPQFFLTNDENSLLFCSNNNNYIVSTCTLSQRCSGAIDSACFPHFIWGLDIGATAQAWSLNFHENSYALDLRTVSIAQSVRCVSYID